MHTTVLKKMFRFICRQLNIDELQDVLYKEDVVTMSQFQQIRALHRNSGSLIASEELLDMVKSSSLVP